MSLLTSGLESYIIFPSKEAYFYAIMQFVKEKNRNELKELLLCENLSVSEKEKKAKVIVNMCNIMAMASSNRNMLAPCAYEETILIFSNAIADYIF